MKDQGVTVRAMTAAALIGGLLAIASLARPVAAKEVVANDCLIGVESETGDQLSGTVSCTDCDPTCDADGVTSANGSCTFRIRGCLNIPNDGTCALRPIKKAKFKTPFAPNLIKIQPVTQPTLACTSLIDFVIPTKKQGTKAGKRTIVANATAAATPASKNKDMDKVVFVCQPRPAGDACPTTTTTTTMLGTSTTTDTTTTTEESTTSLETTTTTEESTTTLETTTTTEESTTTLETTTTTEESTTTLETTTTTEESTTTLETTTTTEESTTTLESTTTTEESTTTTTEPSSPSVAFVDSVSGVGTP